MKKTIFGFMLVMALSAFTTSCGSCEKTSVADTDTVIDTLNIDSISVDSINVDSIVDSTL